MRGDRGLTLVELLAAIVLSALVLALAGRLLLSGHREFLGRRSDSDRLAALVRLKGSLQRALASEIGRCGDGKLSLEGSAAGEDLAAWVRGRFPHADSIVFRCYEIDAAGERLVEWTERFQPQLVEYGVTLRDKGRSDRLEGSVLK